MLYTLVLRIQLEVVQSLLVSKFVIEHTILSIGLHISTEKPSKRDPIDSLSSFEGRFSDYLSHPRRHHQRSWYRIAITIRELGE